jgi:hypothetical protein
VSIRRSASAPLAAPLPVPRGVRPPEPEAPPDPGTATSSRATDLTAGSADSVAVHLGIALAEQMLEDGAADLMPVPAGTVPATAADR